MSKQTHPKIGIMADSHGDPEAIDRGALFLKQEGCTALYHLGDICDTNRYETADESVALVKNHGILAVKGNNDHSLAVDARGRPDIPVHRRTLAFLEDLPLIRSVEDAELVHSRPWVRRLGLSAMIGTIGQREASDYFRKNPRGLLFRGHSHQPELTFLKHGDIRFAPLHNEQVIDLKQYRPCIVTCGAIYQGYVIIWEPAGERLSVCMDARVPGLQNSLGGVHRLRPLIRESRIGGNH